MPPSRDRSTVAMTVAHIGTAHRLEDWLTGSPCQSRRRGDQRPLLEGLRFASYGRLSTAQYQDKRTSRQWQRDCADVLIDGHGQIVTEFFDVGFSRERSWGERPQAAALLAAVANPDRGFDAIVAGEYERAFCGSQLAELAPMLAAHGCSCGSPSSAGR